MIRFLSNNALVNCLHIRLVPLIPPRTRSKRVLLLSVLWDRLAFHFSFFFFFFHSESESFRRDGGGGGGSELTFPPRKFVSHWVVKVR